MYLPKKEGKYASVFESTPSVSQWRQEGGRWTMFFFTSDKGWALEASPLLGAFDAKHGNAFLGRFLP